MLYRVFKLTMMQLGDKLDLRFLHQKNKLLLKILYKVLAVGLLTGVILGLLFLLKNSLFISVDAKLFIFVITFLQLISIVSATGGLTTSMYLAKDNQLLFSFPAKHNEIFLSKLSVFFVYELLRNISFLIPFIIAYGLFASNGGVWWGYWLLIPLALFLLSIIPVLIAVLLSIPVMFITKWLKENPLYAGVALLGTLVGVFTLVLKFLQLIPKNIRFVAMYHTIFQQINLGINWVVNHSLYYVNIAGIFLNNKLFLNLLLIIAIFGTVGTIAYLLARPLYFKMAISSYEFSNKKKYASKVSKEKGPFASYANKEFKLLIRSTDSLIGNFVYLFSLPFVLFVFNALMGAFNIRESGSYMLLSFNILIGLILLLSSNTSSATAFSKEGSQFYLLKIAPIAIKKQAIAKILFNVLISTFILILTCVAIAFATNIDGLNMFMIFMLFLLVDITHIVWSLEIDMMNPDFKEFETSDNAKESKNIKSSISIGLVLSIVVALISYGLFVINMSTAWIKILIIAGIFLAIRIYLFINRLNIYFKEIEM